MIVGLTGGIASGKSTVARLFEARCVPVIDLDVVGREVVAPGSALLERLFEHFGAQFRQADGGLDRRALREHVYARPEERRALEALLHPAIYARAAAHAAAATGPYVIIVNPLLRTREGPLHYDRVLLVDCPESLQRTRLMQRDGSSPAEIEAILAAQPGRAERLALADELIMNDGDAAALEPQVAALHTRYLELAAAR